MNQPAAHFTADPIAGITVDVDLPATQFAAEMPAGRTVNVNLARPHLSANPVHAGQVTFEVESLVAGIASHREHFTERHFAVTVENLESLDLRQRLVLRPVGRETFDFD